ncbi:hypothetical protein LINGRAHAP2_LOCUS21338 [Linum grandiflorum]
MAELSFMDLAGTKATLRLSFLVFFVLISFPLLASLAGC